MKSWIRNSLLAGVVLLGFVLAALFVRPMRAAGPALQLSAPAGPQSAQNPLDVTVQASQLADLGSWEFDVNYDPALVEITGITLHDFFARTVACDPAAARCAVLLGPVAASGLFSAGAVSYGQPAGPRGDGVIATLHLQPKGIGGTTQLHLTNALMTDTAANPITPTTVDATVEFAGPSFSGRFVFLPVVSR